MRLLLLGLSALLILLVTSVGGVAAANAVAENSLPGDAWFTVRQMSESFRITLSPNKSEMRVAIAQYRLRDLTARVGTSHEILALAYFDAALNAALLSLADLPADARAKLMPSLTTLVNSAQALLAQGALTSDPALVARFGDKLDQIRAISEDAWIAPDDLRALAAISLELPAAVVAQLPSAGEFAPRAIPLPGGFQHSFPLDGKHANVACEQCHVEGKYAGTPRACAACHADQHKNAFGQQCERCHTTVAFKPAKMNHTGLTDCASCHTNKKPANHFAGQCSQCHTTTVWKPAKMNHAGLTDCASCHSNKKPANHFAGQCSQCHTTTAWKPAKMNHAGLTDCA
ncbi:MAG: hypothetical protein HY868_17660, partial [Chloroflexi bacterium]|nr:hypothetical protein [Chloroflexota bacterium]